MIEATHGEISHSLATTVCTVMTYVVSTLPLRNEFSRASYNCNNRAEVQWIWFSIASSAITNDLGCVRQLYECSVLRPDRCPSHVVCAAFSLSSPGTIPTGLTSGEGFGPSRRRSWRARFPVSDFPPLEASTAAEMGIGSASAKITSFPNGNSSIEYRKGKKHEMTSTSPEFPCGPLGVQVSC